MNMVLDFLERLPRAAILSIALVMLAALGIIDVETGYEISFSIFYLAPILLPAWYSRRVDAVLISLLSAAMWGWADVTSGHAYSHSAIPVWNSIMRLGFFLIISFSIRRIRELLVKEQTLSRTDFLTKAANSRSFYEFLRMEAERSLRTGRPFSIAYIDVDNFKTVNDTLGHDAGDELLRSIAATIRATIRSLDMVARLGGDEFAVLYPETGEEQVRTVADKMKESLLAMAAGHRWPVTFSLGVITCRGACETDEIIRQADHLMYGVKQEGKNRIAYGAYTGVVGGHPGRETRTGKTAATQPAAP